MATYVGLYITGFVSLCPLFVCLFATLLNVMAVDRETLSILQFLRLTDSGGIGQSQLVIHNSSVFFTARSRTFNDMAAGMEVNGGRRA